MAKRFQPMKEFGKTTKKPKLDISINKKNHSARDNIHSNVQEPAQFNAQSLWDDDEDDVILLASQVAETKIAESTNNQNIAESEITFSEFQPKIQQHSTQRTTEPQVDLLSQMFDDDDDFVRLAAAVEKECKDHVPTSAQLFGTNTSESMVFKKPELPSGSKSKVINNPATPQNVNDTQSMNSQLDPSAAARRQLATDRQVQFLMERLDALKLENMKLNKDLGEVKDNMQAKSGEASMLRDELRRAKQQVENLKMEKLLQTEAANAESKLKIEQLAKEVKTKESQLQLKNMECSVLKMRQADESRRIETSMRDNSSADSKPADEKNNKAKQPTKPRSVKEMLSIMRLRDYNVKPLPKKIESISTILTADAFGRAHERGVSKQFNTFIQAELENIQHILAQIQLDPHTFDRDKLTQSVQKVFSEFWSYVYSLRYDYYEEVQPYHDYDVMDDKSKRTLGCLLLSAPLYEGERGRNLRRYIAILCAVCQKSECATRLILNAKHEDYPLIRIAIDAINKLGFSEDISAHFGIIEAFAVLLRTFLLHLNVEIAEDKHLFDLCFDLLKHLVFTRPNPHALYELSFSVLDCAHRSLHFLSKFCESSERKHFKTERSKSVYRFSDDSCFLQVYCGLMESTFPLYRTLSDTNFELQTRLCINHVRFVFNCLTEPPQFVQKIILMNDEDEEHDKNMQDQNQLSTDSNKNAKENINDDVPSTSKQAAALRANIENSNMGDSSSNNTQHTAKSTAITCDCFTQMCLSVVTMIWLTLRQWLRMDKDKETTRVGLISRVAVHLLHAMFYNNYYACLFREDEDTTRHYFYLICTWWQENASELNFSPIHLKLLQKLRDSYAMPKLIKDEEINLDNIRSDLEQWRQMTHDKDIDITIEDGDTVIKKLRLLDDIYDPDIFFASLNEDHLNIGTFDDD